MWSSIGRSTGRLAMLLALSMLVLGAEAPIARTALARQQAATCAALGTYMVGATFPRPLSNSRSGAAGREDASPKGTGTASTGAAIVVPGVYGYLQGTLTLTAYTSCGTATAGSFLVHAAYGSRGGIQPVWPDGAQAIAIPVVGTSVLTATGTIAQDAMHAGDPTYLAVTATVMYGRHALSCPPVCPQAGNSMRACPAAGCADSTVVTRTAAFGSVTGFMRLQTGARMTVGLVFLPPPDLSIANTSAAMLVQPVAFTGIKTG